MNNMNIPEKEKNLWHKLLVAGYPTFLVGGAVRDQYNGRTPVDLDFTTKATPGQIFDVFQGPNHNIQYVGAHFGVMLIDGVEFATFRKDKYDTRKDQIYDELDVVYCDNIIDDLARRDLTINAMAQSSKGNIIDPYDGQRDILSKQIRFVGCASDRIEEDPLRMIRAIRFQATLGFELAESTKSAIRDKRHLIKGIPVERLGIELMKVMQVPKASVFFTSLKDLGLLDYYFPSMLVCDQWDGGRHHGEDVFTHLMLAGDNISSKYPLIKLAGYLHDLGKPPTYDWDKRTFYDHHTVGTDIVRQELYRLRFSRSDIQTITGLVQNHMACVSVESTPKSYRKLIKRLDEYDLTWKDYLRLRMADKKANLARGDSPLSAWKKAVCHFESEPELPLSAHNLAISGGDIISILNIFPSPLVGQIQKDLLMYVIDNGEEYNNRTDLIHILETNFGQNSV